MDESKILVKKKKKGFSEPFDREKIHKAIKKSAERILQVLSDDDCIKVSDRVLSLIKEEEIGVRKLHNIVEVALDDVGFNRVAESYRQYRNYKEDAQAIMAAVDRKTLELSYKEDKSNANTDSLLVSTKRSILYGEQQKEKYKRIFLNPEERKANDEGYIYINDLKDRLSTFNCFSRYTKLVTNLGVKSFEELYDGQKIQVLDKNGEWKEATVGYFGKQVMYDVVFSSGRSLKTVTCTRDHRWFLKDGTVTTNLKVGDRICDTVDITSKFDPYSANLEDLRTWCFGFIIGDGADSTNQKNGVYARLCGNKTKYLDLFIKAGYVKSSYNYENKDIAVRSKNTPSKQDFLNGSAWKYLPLHSKIALFNGYYAADGGSRANRICTSDKRVCRMIEDISSCSGYYIASKTVINHNTNYKTGATLYMYNLRKRTGITNNWIVKKINYHLNKKKEMDAWCVIEPTTHSFTLEGGLVTGNCDLCNLGRILKDGFVLANIKYTEPKSLNAAMSVSTDIISAYAGQQYGGTTIPEIDTVFAPYAKKSYDFYIDQYKEIVKKANGIYDPKLADEYAEERVRREAEQQYQHMEHSMNSIASSRGDYAFITFTFGHSTDRWAKMISNVFLDVRRGGQGEGAGKVPVLFPKLVFLYDSELHGEGKPLEDLFENAVETAKQCMYPDFLSLDAGYVGDVYHKWGKIISPMGKRKLSSSKTF